MAKPCSDGRRFAKEKLEDDWAIVGALEVVVAVQDGEVVVVVDSGGEGLGRRLSRVAASFVSTRSLLLTLSSPFYTPDNHGTEQYALHALSALAAQLMQAKERIEKARDPAQVQSVHHAVRRPSIH